MTGPSCPTGTTQLIAVIGSPVRHSLSPVLGHLRDALEKIIRPALRWLILELVISKKRLGLFDGARDINRRESIRSRQHRLGIHVT